MVQRFTAIYRNGGLFPTQPIELPEETAVEVEIRDTAITPPMITDPAERALFWQHTFERWDKNPAYGIAGRFTREELHERREY